MITAVNIIPNTIIPMPGEPGFADSLLAGDGLFDTVAETADGEEDPCELDEVLFAVEVSGLGELAPAIVPAGIVRVVPALTSVVDPVGLFVAEPLADAPDGKYRTA